MTPPGIRNALSRARLFKLPATLTEEQWQRTLQHFNHACAYCGSPAWYCVEHATPLPPGGTTVTNCLPACIKCNTAKRGKTLEEMVEMRWPGAWNAALRWLRENGRDSAVEGIMDKTKPDLGPRLPPMTETIVLKIPDADLAKWKTAAFLERLKLGAWIRHAVHQRLIATRGEPSGSEDPDAGSP